MKKPLTFIWNHSEIYRGWFINKYCEKFDSDESVYLFNTCSWYKEKILRKLICELKTNEYRLVFYEENLKLNLYEIDKYIVKSIEKSDSKSFIQLTEVWDNLNKMIHNSKISRGIIRTHIDLLTTELENIKILNQPIPIPQQVEWDIQKIKEQISQIEKFKLATQ